MSKYLQYNSRNSRYATITRHSVTPSISSEYVKPKIDKKNVLMIDEECWEDMIDLAEHYFYQKSGKSVSYTDRKFGDRLIIFLCQSWHDEAAPGRYILRIKK